MKVSKTIGGFHVEVEVKGIRELFEVFSNISEVLHAAEKCEACKQKNTRLNYRLYDNKRPYFEAICLNPNCKAKLNFGKHENGVTLFPSRKDADGNKIPNFGWDIYQRDGENNDGEHDNSHLDEAPESQPQSQSQPPSHQSNNADWRNLIVPLGSNEGKRLGDLSPEVILGYVEYYDNKPPTDIRAQLLHKACKTALKELAAAMAPADDIPF